MVERRRREPRVLPAYRRYEVVLGLLHDFGLIIRRPTYPPSGFAQHPATWRASWHLQAEVPAFYVVYVEVDEVVDTLLSYPRPAGDYNYLIHLSLPEGGRNVSFHKDLTKPPGLLYHWHDYLDGFARSVPIPMPVPVSLLWFLEAAWLLIGNPYLTVQQLLATISPPGPPDPW